MKISPVNDKLARQVLAELKKLPEIKGTAFAGLHFFSNCREQGYVLTVFCKVSAKSIRATFSENRNSDDVVVYWSDMTNRLTSDESWGKASYYDTPKEAAMRIHQHITLMVDLAIKADTKLKLEASQSI